MVLIGPARARNTQPEPGVETLRVPEATSNAFGSRAASAVQPTRTAELLQIAPPLSAAASTLSEARRQLQRSQPDTSATGEAPGGLSVTIWQERSIANAFKKSVRGLLLYAPFLGAPPRSLHSASGFDSVFQVEPDYNQSVLI